MVSARQRPALAVILDCDVSELSDYTDDSIDTLCMVAAFHVRQEQTWHRLYERIGVLEEAANGQEAVPGQSR